MLEWRRSHLKTSQDRHIEGHHGASLLRRARHALPGRLVRRSSERRASGGPTVFLAGGAGIPNYGDELIVDSWLAWYSDRGTRHITVSGSSVAVFDALFGSRERVGFSQAVRVARFGGGRSFYQSIQAGYRYLTNRSNDGSALSREILDSEIFHLHGGGYLNDQWPTHAFFLGLAQAARERGASRVVGTGLGWGPIEDPDTAQREILAGALDAFDFMEVRDQWSYDFVSAVAGSATVVNGVDDAFLQPITISQRPGSALHLSLHSHEDALHLLSRLPAAVGRKFDRIYFWLCVSVDAAAYQQAASKWPNIILLPTDRLLSRIPVHESNYMITSRFHPHLVAARLGMPGAFLAGSDYYNVKHGSLLELGSRLVPTSEKTSFSARDAGQAPLRDEETLVAAKRRLAASIV